MISNSEIRKYVTGRIKPFRGKLLGYSLLYTLLIGLINFSILFVVNFIVLFFSGILVGIVSGLFGSSISSEAMVNMVSQPIISIIQVLLGVLTFAFTIGFMKEILLSVNEQDNTTPIDFFKFGFEKFKKVAGLYFRLLLRYIPYALFMFAAIVLLVVGYAYLFSRDLATLGVVLLIFSCILLLLSIISFIVVFVRYQSLSYDYLYDDKDSSAKEIFKKSRESIKGYRFQWLRMSLFYYVIAFLVVIVAYLLLMLISFRGTIGLMNVQTAPTTILSIVLMIFPLVLIPCGSIALFILMSYFSAKRILNLNELYKLIKKEKVNPVP